MSNMHSKISTLLTVICLLGCKAPAVTRYVSLDGTNDVAGGYTNWAGAATTIQAAISASAADDWIWVSNGTYEVGVTHSIGYNRVAITTAVTIAAWDNDQAATIIKGGLNIRPVFMLDNVTLSGFTITEGNLTASSGGGIRSEGVNSVVSNCLITGNTASGSGGGVYSVGHLHNCDVISNTAAKGGGIAAADNSGSLTVRCCNVIGNTASISAGGVHNSYVFDSHIISNTVGNDGGGGYGTAAGVSMSNCFIKFNSASNGGGVVQYYLFNCEVISNTATENGGGVYGTGSVVSNCLIAGNTANIGGGSYRSFLVNCEVRGNYAVGASGGVHLQAAESITNCLVIGNESAANYGGICGGAGARVENCTIVGNTAAKWHGGAGYITACNVISWSNYSKGGGVANRFTADHYSCAPECTNVTSITIAPQLVDYGSGYGTNHVAGDYRLAQGSPCINTGTNLPWMAEAVDLDGRPRVDRFSGLPDMGCYEHVPQGIIFNLR